MSTLFMERDVHFANVNSQLEILLQSTKSLLQTFQVTFAERKQRMLHNLGHRRQRMPCLGLLSTVVQKLLQVVNRALAQQHRLGDVIRNRQFVEVRAVDDPLHTKLNECSRFCSRSSTLAVSLSRSFAVLMYLTRAPVTSSLRDMSPATPLGAASSAMSPNAMQDQSSVRGGRQKYTSQKTNQIHATSRKILRDPDLSACSEGPFASKTATCTKQHSSRVPVG